MLSALVLAVLNGAVTWGVVSTKLKYMDRDIEDAKRWRERHENLHLTKGI